MYQEYSETLPQDLCFALFYFISLPVKHRATEHEQIIPCSDSAITSFVSGVSVIMLCRVEAEALSAALPARSRRKSAHSLQKRYER